MASPALRATAAQDPALLGELLFAHAVLFAWFAFVGQADGPVTGIAAAVGGAVGGRYLVQRLRAFVPAARGGRLARDRARSDVLAQLLVCWPLNTSLAAGRRRGRERPALLALYLHVALIGLLLWSGLWPVALAWIGGTLPVRMRAAT